MFRLVNWFKPTKILELGTNIGISASYMASVDKSIEIITIEGDVELSKLALQTFDFLKLKNILLIQGEFGEILSDVLKLNPDITLYYIDGNHAKKPTMEYTKQILSHCKEKYLIIYDDIYWSAEMTSCWKEIKKIKDFNVIIDLYHFGMVGHFPEIHCTINESFISTKYKFYQSGFFR